MLPLFRMNNRLVNRYFERERFIHRYYNMFDDLKWNILKFRNADLFRYGVGYGLFNRYRNFFDDWYNNGLRNWDLDRHWMRYRDQHRLVDFKLYILMNRNYNFLVMLDGFWAFFMDVLMNGI